MFNMVWKITCIHRAINIIRDQRQDINTHPWRRRIASTQLNFHSLSHVLLHKAVEVAALGNHPYVSLLFSNHIVTFHWCLFIGKIGQQMEEHSNSFSSFNDINSSTKLMCQVRCQWWASSLSVILIIYHLEAKRHYTYLLSLKTFRSSTRLQFSSSWLTPI